jgi:hypothetical protein
LKRSAKGLALSKVEAVRKVFHYYSSSNWNLSRLAEWLSDQVQKRLKDAHRRGHSLSHLPRVYLLKGLARCVYCGFPLWCETSKPGYGYYREPRNSHAHRGCPATGKAISSRPIDQQVDLLVQSLVLDPNWRRDILREVSRQRYPASRSMSVSLKERK